MPYNPNPFTDRQLAFLKAIHKRLAQITKPDPDVITHESYSFRTEHTVKYGSIPKLDLKPNRQQIKADIMRDAGLDTPMTDHRKSARQKARTSAGHKNPQQPPKSDRQHLAALFDETWNEIMFKVKKAACTAALINQHFTTDTELLAEPMRQIQTIIMTEYQDHIKAPTAPITDPEPARPAQGKSYEDELDQMR